MSTRDNTSNDRLRAFALENPKHPKADNALYFAGVGRMGLQDWAGAAKTLEQLLAHQPLELVVRLVVVDLRCPGPFPDARGRDAASAVAIRRHETGLRAAAQRRHRPLVADVDFVRRIQPPGALPMPLG